MKFLVSLEFLSLALNSDVGSSVQNFHSLGRTLESLKHLKYISLHLRECALISDDALRVCLESALSSTKLQQLDLHFGFCQRISDTGISFLNNGLNQLRPLQNLSLNCMRCTNLTDNALKALGEQLTSIKSLNNLSLNFAGCNNISDKSISYVKDIIMSSKTLKHLSLDFGGCNKISDTGLEYLGNILVYLPSLQDLSLEFWHCRKISDRGIFNLSERLKSLVSLNNLSLAFGGNKIISYQGGLRHLERALPSLCSLKKITLGFTDCQQISDQQFEVLSRAVAGHANRPSLSLNKRLREDFDPPKKWKLESLRENSFLSRAILWSILIFYLCLNIFGMNLIYLFTILRVLATAPQAISDLKITLFKKIQQGFKGYSRLITGFEKLLALRINEIAPLLSRRRKKLELLQSFLALLVFIACCIDIWKRGLTSIVVFIFLGWVVAYPALLCLWEMRKVLLMLVCLTPIGCFLLESLFEGVVIEKFYGTAYYSKNQSRLQDALDLLENPYLNIFGLVDTTKAILLKYKRIFGLERLR